MYLSQVPRSALLCLLLMFNTSVVVAADPLPEPIRAFERLQMTRLAAQQNRPEVRISTFASDGCSGGLSATWQGMSRLLPGFSRYFGDLPPWEHCCVAHDRAYWEGESSRGYEQRLAADLELRACVVETGKAERQLLAERLSVSTGEVDEAFRLISEAMYQAVRFGGAPCTGLPWRWGHGWPECDLAPEDLLPDDVLARGDQIPIGPLVLR